MNFDFSEDQKLLQKTARDFLEDRSPLSLCRSVLESTESYSLDLWKGVAEMGWLGAAIPETYGGAGFGYLELAMLAGEIGRALAPIPFHSSVFLASETLLRAGSEDQKAALLPELATGRRIGTWAVAEGAGTRPLASLTTRIDGTRIYGVKEPVPDGDVASLAVVTVQAPAGPTLVMADLDHESVQIERLESVDPSRSQARLRFDGTPVELLGPPGEGAEIIEEVRDRAAVLIAFEQLGVAERAFEITRAYCMGRYAFGRPIASFQALKHRMADLYCEIELARSNAYFGAWALSHDAEELTQGACAARIGACAALDLASREMIQMHGGVGYTWEYDCHLFYRRAVLLNLLLGPASQWRERLALRLDSDQNGPQSG